MRSIEPAREGWGESAEKLNVEELSTATRWRHCRTEVLGSEAGRGEGVLIFQEPN